MEKVNRWLEIFVICNIDLGLLFKMCKEILYINKKNVKGYEWGICRGGIFKKNRKRCIDFISYLRNVNISNILFY